MMRRPAGAVVVVVVLVAGLATACGSGDDDSVRTPTGRTDGTAASDRGAAAYVGLRKDAAIAKAEASGTPWRITREDDETFMVTLDYDPTRLNFEIDDGIVTRATFG